MSNNSYEIMGQCGVCNNDEKLILKVFDCLIDTALTNTCLDNVYNDEKGESVSWAEVYEARESLTKEFTS
jgi:hypothetical protein|tara:strand:- start:286 stop:495 length:210 start_codon:yes stop_codon:yes gene_type:complete